MMPAATQVPAKYRERVFVVATEERDLVVVAESVEQQRVWLTACYYIVGRLRDAHVLAGIRAMAEAELEANVQREQATKREQAAEEAKQRAETEAAEVARRLQEAAEELKATADAELKEARRSVYDELEFGRKQLHEAIELYGGELQLLRVLW